MSFSLFSKTLNRVASKKPALLVHARNAVVIDTIRFIQIDAQEAVIQKYKDKLNKKAKEVGAKDIGELKEKLKDEIEAKKKEFGKLDVLTQLDKHLAESDTAAANKNPNVIKINSPLAPGPNGKAKEDKPPFKTLKSFIDVEKISELESDQIGLIWRARFQSNPKNVCSVVPVDIFYNLYRTARKNPNFILPLKKENQGHELHFVQWNFSGPQTVHVIFTTLAEYKLHGEFAKPHTTLTFHRELEHDKKIVLMNGLLESDGNVSLAEAQMLILNLQNFYGGLSENNSEKHAKKLKLLEAFNKGTDDFVLEELIKESQDVEA